MEQEEVEEKGESWTKRIKKINIAAQNKVTNISASQIFKKPEFT